ncbi:putative DNA repair protein [Segniliparus rotundus DSM 44985]|uniref:Putative DNA repair protein n=1 Tax=Segniliparus rotundus (strain ATCC BAA-972 / CDC 1076 / CIP 108378 / DSM 44985 / JCM 13578) TaxID=640132 RepID=D6ZB02_SEGRD|nr:alpha-ketoglutarate-dependent dioxygenase AlkB [Segniliparus rotundus]ADG96761.1 putative DNA repair protein [Segniliparus rotundus DSM 44985]
MTLFGPEDVLGPPRERQALPAGAVHLPGWLSLPEQARLSAEFQMWARGPVPLRAAALPNGGRMSVRTVCLGWHWQPYRYTRTADDVNGQQVLPFPDWLGDLAKAVVREACGATAARTYRPDAALVNHYDAHARMGMHQDKDERTDAPVVSLSVGDSCVFRFGNAQGRGKPHTDVRLESGDAFVFGGPSRLAYHGVPKIFPGTAPEGCGLARGRLNITVRATGMP